MMLNESRLYMFTAPHLMIFPGAMIFVTVLAANLLGDALRDVLDPRHVLKRAA
jgi:ABC-type dipeptide/oligopeptide/nickel transport system permease subunit